MYELTRMSPMERLRALRKDYHIGLLPALKEALMAQVSLPKTEKRAAKSLAEMWKKADNPQALIEASIESLPYRTERDIRVLFSRLQLPITDLFDFGNCCVVQIG